MTKPVLIANNIAKVYQQNNLKLKVLDNLDLVINAGEIKILMGPSGTGKTTLLNICGLLDNVTSGKLTINNIETNKLSGAQKTKLRGDLIGFVFQFHHLLPDFTAIENVMLPLTIRSVSYKHAKIKACEILTNLGLADRLNYYPAKLSGGEQQRVAIARALVVKPKLLIADEPTGNLDKNTANEIFNLLLKTAKENQTAMLIATHDFTLTQKLSTTYLSLNNGSLEVKNTL